MDDDWMSHQVDLKVGRVLPLRRHHHLLHHLNLFSLAFLLLPLLRLDFQKHFPYLQMLDLFHFWRFLFESLFLHLEVHPSEMLNMHLLSYLS